nr:hypothetical protein BaRGS_029357 [Batillaria attramentaria]
MDAENEHFRFYTFMRLKLGDNGKKILQDLQAVFGSKCVVVEILSKALSAQVAKDLGKEIAELKQEIRALKQEVLEKDEEIRKMSDRIDELEQYGRRNSVRIYPIPESATENTDEIAIKVANSVGVKIEPRDIDRSHRQPVQHGRPSSTTNKIYVNDDLTATRATLAAKARKLKKDNKIDDKWSRDGVVFLKKNDSAHRLTTLHAQSCQASLEPLLCGAAEVVDAASTGAIRFKPIPMIQNYESCSIREMFGEVRTADGTCNNVNNLGRANAPVARLLPAAYDDSINSPRSVGDDRLPLPSPTEVSRLIHTDQNAFTGRTLMLMQWGQFIDHDITLFPIATEVNEALRCCGPNGETLPYRPDRECLAIELGSADNRFQGSCMEFARSIPARDPAGKKLNTPEGSDDTWTGFLMATSFNDLLPAADEEEENCNHRPGEFCFVAGDIRVNEQPGLTVMHTMWMRLHNVIARELRLRRPSDSSEELFQLTRKIVVAIIQNINYGEYLPIILGADVMFDYKLWPGRIDLPIRAAYVSSVDPRITNAFSTAAFRFGHSMIPRAYNVSGRLVPLREVFNRPDLVFDNFNDMLLALVNPFPASRAQLFDRHMVEEITGHLFEPEDQVKGAPSRGLDLAALNIQRGRDHGLPPYNDFRKLPIPPEFYGHKSLLVNLDVSNMVPLSNG